jgi:hypothetical protein
MVLRPLFAAMVSPNFFLQFYLFCLNIFLRIRGFSLGFEGIKVLRCRFQNPTMLEHRSVASSSGFSPPGVGAPTSSYDTACVTWWLIETHNPRHHSSRSCNPWAESYPFIVQKVFSPFLGLIKFQKYLYLMDSVLYIHLSFYP